VYSLPLATTLYVARSRPSRAACSCPRAAPGRAPRGGRAAAAAIPGITGLTITIPAGQRVLPLPDGDRYLGFIFAEADTGPGVEQALTAAHEQLHVVIG
jgi:L-amino acid ligase C-terminal domain 2